MIIDRTPKFKPIDESWHRTFAFIPRRLNMGYQFAWLCFVWYRRGKDTDGWQWEEYSLEKY